MEALPEGAAEAAGLQQLFYVSKAALGMEGLAPLLKQARRNNALKGLCGLLVYSGNHFAQVLEGPKAELAALARRISIDNRHHGMRVLQLKDIDSLSFGLWSMALLMEPQVDAELGLLVDDTAAVGSVDGLLDRFSSTAQFRSSASP